MVVKTIGRIIGLGACITSVWIIFKIFNQGYIHLVETNLIILHTELFFMIMGIVILVYDIYGKKWLTLGFGQKT